MVLPPVHTNDERVAIWSIDWFWSRLTHEASVTERHFLTGNPDAADKHLLQGVAGCRFSPS